MFILVYNCYISYISRNLIPIRSSLIARLQFPCPSLKHLKESSPEMWATRQRGRQEVNALGAQLVGRQHQRLHLRAPQRLGRRPRRQLRVAALHGPGARPEQRQELREVAGLHEVQVHLAVRNRRAWNYSVHSNEIFVKKCKGR